jgi:hypothetical protein
MELPNDEGLKSCYRAFCDTISNEVLKTYVCVLCAHEKDALEGQNRVLLEIPKIQRHLVPKRKHPAQKTWNGLLLSSGHIEGQGSTARGWICYECLNALTKDQTPKLALVNDIWIGPIPHELSILTIPE